MAQKPTQSTSHGVQLTPNFTLAELIDSDQATRLGIDNTPNSPTAMANLYKVAQLLEAIRKLCGNKPVIVSSGYRSPRVNAMVGGSSSSEHMTGAAADFRIPGFGTPLQICKAIVAAKIPFGQLIWEGSWVHISIADGHNDGQVMTAKFVQQPDGRVKAVYTQGLPA